MYSVTFSYEENCNYVMEKRPLTFNGLHLNIREWPLDGSWSFKNFETSIFWVQVHDLPIPYSAEANGEAIEAKIGIFRGLEKKKKEAFLRQGYLRMRVEIHPDQQVPARLFLPLPNGKSRWVQFKYERLLRVCFNCGKLQHEEECKETMAMVIPPSGKAVRMYGVWLKAESAIDSCFMAAMTPPPDVQRIDLEI